MNGLSYNVAWLPVCAMVLLAACSTPSQESERAAVHVDTVDPDATAETKALLYNLDQVRARATLFGHQDDLAYGVNWRDEPGRSDVKETAGAYPAVYGWELGDLERDSLDNLDGVNFEKMKGWIREGYERGGVVTIAWHMNHPVTDGNAWDRTPGIAPILPDSSHHHVLVQNLDKFAAFVADLRSSKGGRDHPIPLIFRPWHEHNGDWFWWGKGLNAEADYVALWRFTVEYLRDVKGLRNLLYAFSPDRSRIDIERFNDDYLYAFPGDDYVDIMGLDNYWDVGQPSSPEDSTQKADNLRRSLRYTVELAEAHGKVPAMTETGSNALPNPTWYTGTLLSAIRHDEATRRLAYVVVWRNANAQFDRPDHFYAPYPGHPAAEDFVKFRNDPAILFEADLPPMYRISPE